MFRQIRYQTGELEEIISEMKAGKIPCMDVDNTEELNWFIEKLSSRGIYKIEDLLYNRTARNRINEPEFEFRIGFYTSPLKSSDINSADIMYIDFYFEPDIEKTYDTIFGD